MNNKIGWKFIVSAILVLCGLSCLGQETAITATVTDSDGQTWNNAQWKVTFVTTSAYPNINTYTINGVPIVNNPTYKALLDQNGLLNGSGQLSINLLDNTQISPSGSQWAFTIQSNTSAPATQYPNVGVSGSSQSLTSFLSTNSIVPRFPASPVNFGYLDAEVTPIPQPGGYYFNVTLGYSRQWNGTAWQNFTTSSWNGGAVTNPITSSSTIQGAFAPINPKSPPYNAKIDGRSSDPNVGQDGCTSTTNAVVNCSDLNFTSADVGKVFTLRNAGTSGAVWRTTVLSVQSTTQATMTSNSPIGVTSQRAAIGTDDTAAWTSAITAAATNAGIVIFPDGFSMINGPLTIPSGISIVGANAQTYVTPTNAPDFTLYPTGGSWFDCEGVTTSCLVGNSGGYTNQVTLANFGMTDATNGLIFGSNTTGGFAWGVIENVIFSGNAGAAAAKFSQNGFEIYNSQHLYTNKLFASFVNSGLHLITGTGAGSGCCASNANNTYNDTYIYSNVHSAANGNVNSAPIWIVNASTTAGVNTTPLGAFTGQTQVNDYSGDGTNYHIIIDGGAEGVNNGIFQAIDMEGAALCGVKLINASAISFFFTTAQGTDNICFDANSNNNIVEGAGTFLDAGVGNFFYGASIAYPFVPIQGDWFDSNLNVQATQAAILGEPQIPAVGTGANGPREYITGFGSNGTASVRIGATLQAIIANGTNPGFSLAVAPYASSTTGSSIFDLTGWPRVKFNPGATLDDNNTNWQLASNFVFHSTGTLYWSAGACCGSIDTGIQRGAAGVVRAVSTTGGQSGTFEAATIQTDPLNPFTVTGCGTATSISGGADAGTFVVGTGATPCTFVLTINGSVGLTAPHGYICEGDDQTSGVHLTQSASSTTTCSLTGNAATSDKIGWSVVRAF